MTNTEIIIVNNLSIADLEKYPVWQYCNNDTIDELSVKPIKRLPVKNLNAKLVGTKVQLANGVDVWALISNIDVDNPKLTKHFLTISIMKNGEWFTLSRYHDYDYSIQSPKALADFLGLKIEEVFPISYDISKYSKGSLDSLKGKILIEPDKKLSRAEIIAFAVPKNISNSK